MKLLSYATCLVILATAFVGQSAQARAQESIHGQVAQTFDTPCQPDMGFAVSECTALGDDLFLVQVTLRTRILTFYDSFVDCSSLTSVNLIKETAHAERDRFAELAREIAASAEPAPVERMALLANSAALPGGSVWTDTGMVKPAFCNTLREAR